MATSGSIDYAQTRDDVITEALELLGVLGEGESPSNNQLTSCGRTLNYMIKSNAFNDSGLYLQERMVMFFVEDDHDYTLHTAEETSDRSCTFSDFITTLVNGAIEGGDTITEIVVDDTTGMVAGDEIGLPNTSNTTLQWTTIEAVESATGLNLDAAVETDLADNARIYTYTNRAERPKRILGGVRRTSAEVDTPLDIITQVEYQNLNTKASDGPPNQIYHDRLYPSSTLFCWPEPEDESEYFVLWIERPVEDLDAAANEVDFPQEWFLPLAYNLAKFLIPKYGVSENTRNTVIGLADQTLADARSLDTEDELRVKPRKY